MEHVTSTMISKIAYEAYRLLTDEPAMSYRDAIYKAVVNMCELESPILVPQMAQTVHKRVVNLILAWERDRYEAARITKAASKSYSQALLEI